MKYIKRPPTYNVIFYDGTEESYERIREALQMHTRAEAERIEYDYSHSTGNYVKLFKWASGYYSEKKKEVIVDKGDYAVIREDGKYYSYGVEEFYKWFREAP